MIKNLLEMQAGMLLSTSVFAACGTAAIEDEAKDEYVHTSLQPGTCDRTCPNDLQSYRLSNRNLTN